MTKDNLVRMIDQTLLKPYATDEQLISFCREGARHGFASVCVSSTAVPVCAPVLRGTGTALCAVVGFPLGQTSINIKSAEAREAIAGGAGEIDYVINIGKAKGGDWDYVREEMLALTALCHQAGARVKVILETCYLTEEEVRSICAIAAEVKPDFVKTSTGLGTA
ncbi:MAG: deoxyribose-phosphate aldolase, partial [Clostridia bacterium]|nr:deoxyribose-phosphate aldolase [Clostridia bacterium]